MKHSNLLSAATAGLVLVAALTACSVKQSGGKGIPMPKIAKDGTLWPQEKPTCEQREKEMADLTRDAQAQYEAAIHGGFEGRPNADTSTLKAYRNGFEMRYSSLRCDGQTTKSFLESIDRFISEIERYK